jgi:5'-3' exonuclease
MILLDNSQLILSTIFTQYSYTEDKENFFSEDTVRHIVLNTYRYYKNKFGKQYGDLVICDDSSDSWRKDVFPHYKASRKKNREDSSFDWKTIFNAMNKIRREVRENFPYKVMSIPRCEADDIIAVLCEMFHNKQDILIISSDKDFQQLQHFTSVKQYSPIHKDFLYCENPHKFLVEHILRGDASDGIPNILSDDDTFVVEKKRQRPLSQKKLESLFESVPDYLLPKYERNLKLINFNSIPDDIREIIVQEYNKPKNVQGKEKLFQYFVENKLSNLMEVINEF